MKHVLVVAEGTLVGQSCKFLEKESGNDEIDAKPINHTPELFSSGLRQPKMAHLLRTDVDT